MLGVFGARVLVVKEKKVLWSMSVRNQTIPLGSRLIEILALGIRKKQGISNPQERAGRAEGFRQTRHRNVNQRSNPTPFVLVCSSARRRGVKRDALSSYPSSAGTIEAVCNVAANTPEEAVSAIDALALPRELASLITEDAILSMMHTTRQPPPPSASR